MLYLIRDTRQYWEDTNVIISLQDRRTVTKKNYEKIFEIDSKEIFRIISNKFSTTTLEYAIISHQSTQNGTMTWKIIKSKVKDSNCNTEF